MENCIFCKIVAGKLPSDKVYEDDQFIAFQALTQSSEGHTLIIPKEHSEDVLSMDTALGPGCLDTIQKVGTAMMKGLPCDGFNVAINTKPAAGQVVFHTHIHLIPRRENDQRGDWPKVETSEEERTLFAEKIIREL